jgi:hypothetical protein
MLRRLAIAVIAAGLPATVALAYRTTDSPQVSASGHIGGTVIDAASGVPVRFASVTLGSPAGKMVLITDDSGSFAFDRLGPGSYTLQISKSGYLDTAYGQTRPGTSAPGKHLALSDRQRIDRLVIPLSHGGSIAGSVRDDHGDPAFQATVLVRKWIPRDGARTLVSVSATKTDERGRYRVSLLPPGQYIVSAAPADDSIPAGQGEPHPDGFAPVFYPAGTSVRGATTIPIGLGEEKSNIDLQFPLVPLARITGTVFSLDGQPAAGVAVTLIDVAGLAGDESEWSTDTGKDGRFTFERVVPGDYQVKAETGVQSKRFAVRTYQISIDRSRALVGKLAALEKDIGYATQRMRLATEPPPGQPRGWTSTNVSLSGGIAPELVLTIEPLHAVSGRIAFTGVTAPPAPDRLEIVLTGLGDSGETQRTKVASDGTFTLPNVMPGKYSVSVSGASSSWIPMSAVSAGVDTFDALLDVPSGRDVRDLAITLSDRDTELYGTVTDASAQPATDHMVVVFPVDERLWPTSARRLKAVTLSIDGRYSFPHLPPGSYRLAVVDGLEPNEWLDPDFLRSLAAASIAVTVTEGRVRQDLRIR